MEFWGVEVKAGESFEVSPGLGKILHLSQASLGESKKGKGNETVPLTLKFDDQKLILGTLSSEKFPQLSFDLVFEKTFELSHTWKNGSVYFCGYKTVIQDDDDEFSDYSDSDEELPLQPVENGKPEKTLATKVNAAKPDSAAKPTGKAVELKKDSKSLPAGLVEDDSDEDDSDDSDEDMSDADSDDSEGDESDEEDEDTPKKPDVGKKRPTESATKTPIPAKKAKLATPQKTDGKKGVHTATPYPTKQAGKTGADSAKAKSPKSGGDISCKSCSRTFKTEASMQSHSAAKHSGGK